MTIPQPGNQLSLDDIFGRPQRRITLHLPDTTTQSDIRIGVSVPIDTHPVDLLNELVSIKAQELKGKTKRIISLDGARSKKGLAYIKWVWACTKRDVARAYTIAVNYIFKRKAIEKQIAEYRESLIANNDYFVGIQ